MKMIKEEFERIARERGYESGVELFEELGFTAEHYEDLANGAEIDRDTLLKLCRELGTSDVIDFIDFGSFEWESNIDLFEEI